MQASPALLAAVSREESRELETRRDVDKLCNTASERRGMLFYGSWRSTNGLMAYTSLHDSTTTRRDQSSVVREDVLYKVSAAVSLVE